MVKQSRHCLTKNCKCKTFEGTDWTKKPVLYCTMGSVKQK
jgi:hypothetical protein